MDRTSPARPPEPRVFDHRSPESYLRALLEFRSGQNPSYGANAFSRQLGVSPATLSLLFAGKRFLSRTMGEKIAAQLRLERLEEDYFLGLTDLSRAETESERQKIFQSLGQIVPRESPRKVQEDRFSPIARWSTMALLEVVHLEPIRSSDYPAIAEKLGLTADEVSQALENLCNENLIEKLADGSYRRPIGEVQVDNPNSKAALDAYHRQLLEKATAELEFAELADRIYASNFFTFAKSDLPLVRKRVYSFLDELHDLSRNVSAPDSVYGMSLGMFNVFEKKDSA